MLDDLTRQLMVFVGTIGAVFCGFVGLITRHTDENEGVNWRKVFNELPIAIFSGLIAAGIGGYASFPPVVTFAMASALAHVGPPTVTSLVQMLIASKLGGKK